jgi:hypothetical protein
MLSLSPVRTLADCSRRLFATTHQMKPKTKATPTKIEKLSALLELATTANRYNPAKLIAPHLKPCLIPFAFRTLLELAIMSPTAVSASSSYTAQTPRELELPQAYPLSQGTLLSILFPKMASY